jgi:hypothetical protein
MRPAGATLRLFAQWLRPTTNTLKANPNRLAFFVCYRVFTRVLADYGESDFWRQPAGLTLRLRILSPTLPTQCRPKSGRHACHTYINQ